MGGVTNRGRKMFLKWALQQVSLPANFFMALVTDTFVPDVDTNLMSDLEEIAAGNGYTAGGYSLNPDATDFNSLNEDDTNDRADVTVKDVDWTAAGGSIPASGGDARYAVLTDDDATVANRNVLAWFDLGSGQSRADGLSLILTGAKVRATLPV